MSSVVSACTKCQKNYATKIFIFEPTPLVTLHRMTFFIADVPFSVRHFFFDKKRGHSLLKEFSISMPLLHAYDLQERFWHSQKVKRAPNLKKALSVCKFAQADNMQKRDLRAFANPLPRAFANVQEVVLGRLLAPNSGAGSGFLSQGKITSEGLTLGV